MALNPTHQKGSMLRRSPDHIVRPSCKIDPMALLTLSVAVDPARLLARATRGLFPLPAPTESHPWPTLPAWLVLRQGGLRDDLHQRAASAGVDGWFDPPVCLFAELPRRWSELGERPLSGPERIALLSNVVARHAEGVFDRGGNPDAWIPSIDRHIGELIGEGITSSVFGNAVNRRADRDRFEQRRDEALVRILADWEFTLNALGRRDGRDAFVALATHIERNPDAFAERLGGRRDVRIVGLADLRGGWRPLLRALAACPNLDTVTILSSHEIALPSELHAVIEYDRTAHAAADGASDELIASESASFAARLFTESAPVAYPALQLLEAPDSAREIEHIAVRVRELLDKPGTAPNRIAVAVRQARPGVDRVADALTRMGIPVTARRRAALAHTGPAKALRALLNVAAEGFTRHAVVEVAEHPLLALALDADVLQAAGASAPISSLEDWSTALTRILERCQHRDATPAEWRAHRGLPDTDRASRTLLAWTKWLPLARSLAERRTDSEWYAWVRDVLTGDAWGVSQRLDAAPANDMLVWRADIKAAAQIASLASDWSNALLELQVVELPCGAAAFTQRFALVLDADLITQPETGFGVVVAEALAVGWRAFDHLFVVGLASGEFPRRPPPSSLLADRDRYALIAAGLPLDPPDAWRAREQELFRVLCAAPSSSLTLSWPGMDSDGREIARSAYVDDVIDHLQNGEGRVDHVQPQEVLTPSFPLVARDCEAQVQAQVNHGRAIEGARSRDASAYNGQIAEQDTAALLRSRFGDSFIWSATQLEELAKCRWSWFAKRVLRLDEAGELDDGLEPTTRGSILHDALNRFFTAASARTAVPVYLGAHDRSWVHELAAQSLAGAWHHAGQSEWLGHPSLHDILRAELLAQLSGYLDFEIDHNEKSGDNRTKSSKQIRMGALHCEQPFGPIEIEGDGLRFRLHGTIDRVDVGVDERIDESAQYIAAIDYKSSVGSTPAQGSPAGWDDGIVLQVPLYARVLQLRYPEQTLARLEYRTLKKPKAVHTLEFVKVLSVGKGKTAGKTAMPNPDADAMLARALDDAGRRVRQARDGAFPADPARSSGCSPYCVARDICRIPGGPVEAER